MTSRKGFSPPCRRERAACTTPAPARSAAIAVMCAAPVMPLEPPTTSTVPTERLWSRAPLGTSSGARPSSVRSQTSVSWPHSGGMPIGETTTSPLCGHDTDVWLLTEDGLAPLLVPKGARDHKRSVGTVLVVGGSRGMTGAAHMTAMAALRAGAGLVHAALPQGAGGENPFLEVITVEAPGAAGQFTAAARSALFEQAAGLKAVAVGPGLGRGFEAQLLVRKLLGLDRPLLLDADGLYALGDRPELLADRKMPTVLTPHEGELGRLLGRPADEVAAQRLECVRSAAQRSGATVLLKGEASIVADPSGRAYVVPTGNPGLATPGTGDVLSGVIVAQLAKGLGATEAACLGAYLHGLAADLAAENAVGTEGMVAGDVIQFLPAAVERLKAGPQEETHEHH